MINIIHYVGKNMLKWMLIATLVGIGGGIASAILRLSIDLVGNISKNFPIWLTPIIGSILVSFIIFFDKNAAGFGTDLYIAEVNKEGVHLSRRNMYTKLLATSLTLGFNGSGGVEGPMLVIGGSIGDLLFKMPIIRRFFTQDDDKRLLTICGAAGAIGAIFRSPLGGGIFVVEILYKSTLNYGDLFPAILSSTMGFVVFSMLSSGNPLYDIPDYLPDVSNIPLFLLAGVVSGIGSLIFMYVLGKVQNQFNKIKYTNYRPIIGGLLTGIIIYFLPRVAGTGNSVIQEMIDGSFSIGFLIMLFIGKIFATSFTVGSGGSAGLVIPALYIGAIAGNSISTVLNISNGGLESSLVISGMAASLASIANVPIAGAIMLVEMVGLRLGVPAAIGSIIGYAIGHGKVIYGVTCPDQWMFEETVKWKNLDANNTSH